MNSLGVLVDLFSEHKVKTFAFQANRFISYALHTIRGLLF